MARLKASSIIEVTVAMVITSLSLGAGMMLFQQVSQSSYSLQQVKAEQLLLAKIEQTVASKHFINQKEVHDEMIIEQTVSDYAMQEGVIQVYMVAMRKDGKILSELKRLLYELD